MKVTLQICFEGSQYDCGDGWCHWCAERGGGGFLPEPGHPAQGTPWTHYWMLKSTCECLSDSRCVCILISFFRHRYSAKGTIVKKISVINKGLFHLINDIFWNLGFNNETQADKVIVITRIKHIIPLISNILIIQIGQVLLDPDCNVTATLQSEGPKQPSGAYLFAPVGHQNRYY